MVRAHHRVSIGVKRFKLVFSFQLMRKALLVLLVAALLANFAEGVYTPLYAAYVEQIGGGLSDAGVSWSLNLIVYGVLAILFSRLGVKNKYRVGMLVAGYLLAAIVTGLFAVISTPLLLYIVQMIRGASWAVLAPVWDAFYSLFVDKGSATTEWGYYEGGWSIAMGVGSALGGLLISLTSFTFLFSLSAFLTLLAAVLVWIYRDEFV